MSFDTIAAKQFEIAKLDAIGLHKAARAMAKWLADMIREVGVV